MKEATKTTIIKERNEETKNGIQKEIHDEERKNNRKKYIQNEKVQNDNTRTKERNNEATK